MRHVLLLSFILFSCIFLDLWFGSVAIHVVDYFSNRDLLFSILTLRFQSLTQSFLSGSLLSLSGYLLQKAFRNPIADPSVLGISAGGSFFGLLFFLHGYSILFLSKYIDQVFLYNLGCFLGCLFSFFLLGQFKKLFSQYQNNASYLLSGLILNSVFSSLSLLFLILAPQDKAQEFYPLLVGSLRVFEPFLLYVFFIIAIFFVVIIIKVSKNLKYLDLDDSFAKTLGINNENLRKKIVILSSFLIVICVSLMGNLAFVGLIVPHFMRKFKVKNVILEILYTIFLGGSLVIFADFLSRVVAPPLILPLGIFTALVGAPILLSILIKYKKCSI